MRQGKILHKNLSKIVLRYNKILNTNLGQGLIASLFLKIIKTIQENTSRIKSRRNAWRKGCLYAIQEENLIKLGPPLIINSKVINKASRIIFQSIEETFHETH